MSFQETKREYIKRYMLDKIRDDDADFIKKTAENFTISVTSVKRYIQDCLERNVIEENGKKQTGYSLVINTYEFAYDLKDSLNEDIIYFQDIMPLLKGITPQGNRIWEYSFMEMMNNAIEHSRGQKIHCVVKQDYLYTEISIADDGIGIFKKIQNYMKQKYGMTLTYLDVINELHKGKLTTSSMNHSGEGVFFTSRVLDEYVIFSEDTLFVQKCYDRDQFVQSHLIAYFNKLHDIGTMVIMKLDNYTEKSIEEVFNVYAPIDEGFSKTRIAIKEVCQLGRPIARSQARRLLFRLEQFKVVELDFLDVEYMGQGFADEVFRVFKREHPEVEIIAIHANPSVLGMIKHVQVNG